MNGSILSRPIEQPRSEYEVRALLRERDARKWNALCDGLEHGTLSEVAFIDRAHELGICASRIADELRRVRVEVEGLE